MTIRTSLSVDVFSLPARRVIPRSWTPYVELAKVRLVGLVLFTTGVGFLLAGDGGVDWVRLVWTLAGVAMAAGGANALNQWMEAGLDARMARTRRRPLPDGRLSSAGTFCWGMCLGVAGPIVLVIWANPLTAGLAVSAEVVYLLAYTPLKSRTSLCTLVGAYCGAAPPMLGWAAAVGRLDYGAWILGVMLYVWQIPHSLALGWLYRRDYARAGVRILPAVDPAGRTTCEVILLYSLALLPLSLSAALAGMAGRVYILGAVVLGSGLLGLAVRMYRVRTDGSARHLFLASIIYLAIVLGLMVADRHPAGGPSLLTPSHITATGTMQDEPLGPPTMGRPHHAGGKQDG